MLLLSVKLIFEPLKSLSQNDEKHPVRLYGYSVLPLMIKKDSC